jgi:hypothetical protein
LGVEDHSKVHIKLQLSLAKVYFPIAPPKLMTMHSILLLLAAITMFDVKTISQKKAY